MINLIKKNAFVLLAIASAGILFSSCLKTDNPDNTPAGAGIMAFNLAPDQSSVNFAISGSRLTNQSIPYSNYTGVYLAIYGGTGQVEAYNNAGVKIASSATTTFTQGKYYSAFLVGKDSTFENIVAEDNLDSLPMVAGTAYVRYINAVADSSLPAVKISSGGTEVVNNSAPFKSVSDFRAITAGDITVSINNESSTINATRTFAVEANKIYTILLAGKAASTNPDSLVQIKFITNATITQ
ncbi:DUF4397 domain-containing protein [Ferruginibacter sp. HRS2-29]|uniref:DUF4397 domain-containing protein n=1 Tax=Ferruginibacter sp. HRS2-29 TaxID=2487334 RepID=UPI0020CC5982|nr:DUF4397 domain-containing protein [Ferruginibacter sp. HRS2-29]MCP9750347.1 DUF4397 domain-containing protein [Ferruginibacter sp. HRS2-29]